MNESSIRKSGRQVNLTDLSHCPSIKDGARFEVCDADVVL